MYYTTVYQWNSCKFLSTPWEHGQLKDKLQDNYALGSHEGGGEKERTLRMDGAENTEGDVALRATEVQSRR